MEGVKLFSKPNKRGGQLLGRQMLYQLSYSRIRHIVAEYEAAVKAREGEVGAKATERDTKRFGVE